MPTRQDGVENRDNVYTVSDSDSSWDERADEGRINPIEEAKRLGTNLATTEKAKISDIRERKIQTNSAGKNRNKTNFKCNQVEKNSNYIFGKFLATLKIK